MCHECPESTTPTTTAAVGMSAPRYTGTCRRETEGEESKNAETREIIAALLDLPHLSYCLTDYNAV